MHRLIRRSPLPVGLAVAAAAAPAGAGVAPSADAAGDRAAAPASDLAAPAPVAMQWASRGVRMPRTITLYRRAAARRAGRRVVRTRARAVVRAVRSQIGDPYAYGAGGPGAFDCSGLTAWAMRRAGISLPHSSFAQAETGMSVARGHVRAGDLVFFSTAGPGASHVGIATSRDTVVSATSHGVMTHSISDSYWGGAYDGARRVVTHRR